MQKMQEVGDIVREMRRPPSSVETLRSLNHEATKSEVSDVESSCDVKSYSNLKRDISTPQACIHASLRELNFRSHH